MWVWLVSYSWVCWSATHKILQGEEVENTFQHKASFHSALHKVWKVLKKFVLRQWYSIICLLEFNLRLRKCWMKWNFKEHEIFSPFLCVQSTSYLKNVHQMPKSKQCHVFFCACNSVLLPGARNCVVISAQGTKNWRHFEESVKGYRFIGAGYYAGPMHAPLFGTLLSFSLGLLPSTQDKWFGVNHKDDSTTLCTQIQYPGGMFQVLFS